MQKIWTALSIIVAIIAGLVFFYPTPYRYEDGGMTRVNRFTGAVQHASSEGWAAPEPTVDPDKLDPITPEITKAYEGVQVAAQDFESITLKNPSDWNLVLIEKAEVSFGDACGGSDYVTFITGDRNMQPKGEVQLRLPYSESFKKNVIAKCAGAAHKRTVTLILNSGNGPEGKRWDAQSRLVQRKIEGEVQVPAS